MIENIFTGFVLKLFLTVKEKQSKELGKPKNILLNFQHYSAGLLLTQIPLIKAIKKKYPQSTIAAIVSTKNSIELIEDHLINNHFIFEKKKLFNLAYLLSLKNFLQKQYDLTIVPVTLSVPLTSLLLMRFSNSTIKIGTKSLNGMDNKYQFLFDRRIDLDWRKTPDAHISDFSLDIVRPFNIDTKDFLTQIFTSEAEKKKAQSYLNRFKTQFIIGLNLNADKPQNKWSLIKFVELIEKLKEKYDCTIYLTNLKKDKETAEFVKEKLSEKIEEYDHTSLGEIAEVISKSDLFITNADDIMFIAGATSAPQITLFGEDNPFNLSPIGKNKYFLKKSDLISEITVEEVFEKCEDILTKKK